MIKCNLCVRHFHERKTFNIQHSGGSRGGTRGGPPPPPIFRPNWGPKGQKTFFLETAPPFLRIWMTAPPPPPPPLSQGLDPVIQHHSPGPDPSKLTMWEIGRLRNICRERNRWCLKPGFHMSGKSQTIRDFTFCRPSQIWPIYRSDNRRDSPDIEFEGKWKMRQKLKFVHKCMIGRLESILKFWGLRRSEIHRRRPRQYKFEFSFVGNDTDHRRNLGRVGKQQNPRSSGIFPTNENQA